MQYKQIFYTKFCTQTLEKLFQFMEDQPFIIWRTHILSIINLYNFFFMKIIFPNKKIEIKVLNEGWYYYLSLSIPWQSDKIISPLSYTFIEILIFVKIFMISHNERNSKFDIQLLKNKLKFKNLWIFFLNALRLYIYFIVNALDMSKINYIINL